MPRTTEYLYLEGLRRKLAPHYIAQGCHDLPHVMRMEAMSVEISELIKGFADVEFRIAVWLHNLDRCAHFEEEIKQKTLPVLLQEMLKDSGLSAAESADVVLAVRTHSKFLDDPDDSPLLQALRLADKWDRIGILGGISGFQWLGCKMPAYDPQRPFGYGSTAEGDLASGGKGGYTTLYQNFYRILEWYTVFPLVRELVRRHPHRFKHLLFFIRSFAFEVAEAHGVKNNVEDDIKRCLGEHYKDWAPYGD